MKIYQPRFREMANYKSTRITVPIGFNKAVQERLNGEQSVSSSYISMVRRGTRRNDTVLKAIIEVDHYWKQLEAQRLKNWLL